MLYQLSHVRAPRAAPSGVQARLETIAEPRGGVQTFPAPSGLPADRRKINFGPGYPHRVTLTTPTSVRQTTIWCNGELLDRPDQAVVGRRHPCLARVRVQTAVDPHDG